jgi:signal transduction histidine kinase
MSPPSRHLTFVPPANRAMPGPPVERTAVGVLARVAHQMLQPLSAAVSALQLLRECHDEPIGTRAGVIVDQQFQRLSRFVDDLLEASRLQSGRTTLRLERVDMRGLVDERVEAVRGQASIKRQRLERGDRRCRCGSTPTPHACGRWCPRS